jgi:sialic acid synthase SpsE
MITLKSGRTIGGPKPFIIAEIGSNWTNIQDCANSISQARAAGADAVKFQAFTAKDLYGFKKNLENTRMDEMGRLNYVDPVFDALNKASMPLEWLPKLKEKADAVGIEFMCTAFSPELYDKVNPFVNAHKVASAEMSHVRILEKVRSLGKPVILSTGASTERDIKEALRYLTGTDSPNPPVEVILMYCVAAYPARDIDFRHIAALKKLNPLVGYSDHTTDYNIIPREAVKEGAVVIEKHMTAIEADTPDRPHSLTVSEFKKMVESIRGDRPFTWGSGEENEMRCKHNRRLVATQHILPGQLLLEQGNFGIFRSLVQDERGLSPFSVARVHGRSAKRAIKAGEAIGPGDFE